MATDGLPSPGLACSVRKPKTWNKKQMTGNNSTHARQEQHLPVAAAAFFEITSGKNPTDPYSLNILPRSKIV